MRDSAKTYLPRLFAKTGTDRQTDLVKLVATHASPLRQVPEQSITVAIVQRFAINCLAEPPFEARSTRRLTRAS
jgi:hypothetical protein